jgi:GR25 family glycosyltransferase involved in LPS biosynthesis
MKYNHAIYSSKHYKKTSIGYIEGKISHLQHGSYVNRQYTTRDKIIHKLNFVSNNEHIVHPTEKTLTEFRNPYSMNNALLQYFVDRKDDDFDPKPILEYSNICAYTKHYINDGTNERPINRFFPNIYVITLADADSTIRREHVTRILQTLGANYTMCHCIQPGQAIYDQYLAYYKRTDTSLRKLTIGELGCCMSQAWLLERINTPLLNGHATMNTTHSSGLHLILEDDILHNCDFDTQVTKIMSSITNPSLLQLHASDWNIHKRTITNNMYIPLQKDGNLFSAGAYACTKAVGNFLLKHIQTFLEPADHYFVKAYAAFEGTTRGVVYPPLFLTDRSSSSITSRDEHVIQTYYAQCFPNTELKHYYNIPLKLFENRHLVKHLQQLFSTHTTLTDIVPLIPNTTHWNSESFLYTMLIENLPKSPWSISDFRDFFHTICSPDVEMDDFAVCIVYSNPTGSLRILQNFLQCRTNICKLGVSVYVLDVLSCENTTDLVNIPNVVPFHWTTDVSKYTLWKRLVTHIPSSFTKFVFVDSNILFEGDAWPSIVSAKLSTYDVLQPYSTVRFLNLEFKTEYIRPGYVCTLCRNSDDVSPVAYGHAFACTRKWLNTLPMFFQDYHKEVWTWIHSNTNICKYSHLDVTIQCLYDVDKL